MILDRLDAGMSCSRRRRKRTVPDLELDDILALDFQGFRHCEDIKRGFGVKSLGKSAESNHGRSNSKNQIPRSWILEFGSWCLALCRIHCLAAIVCANGRTTAGMIWLSTSS